MPSLPPQPSRRNVLALSAASLCSLPTLLRAADIAPSHPTSTPNAAPPPLAWPRGIENQRKADLGNGTYLNPILAGDHPDPSVLKVGDDYYMVHSSFLSYPGLQIWHSQDLVNWQPLGPALRKNVGSVWAPDLAYVNNKFYIYFPGIADKHRTNYVVWADKITGPWSDPIDLHIGEIDPGHALTPEGKRFLVLSGGNLVPLADDGLSVTGPIKKVYDGWKIPDDWIVESFSQEGPKISRHGDYYYMTLAEGGTAGPPTSHMVISARAKSLDGPWENSPYNPIVHTKSGDEHWWSRGHGTLVEGPGGQWYLVYHSYENGFYTLGRQTLLEPVVWTDDGWFKSTGIDIAKPIPKPNAPAVPHGFAFSDDFSTNKMGLQWSFFKGDANDTQRFRYEDHALIIKGQGQSPKDCSPLTFAPGDQAYQVELTAHLTDNARAGLILFYDDQLYAGLGFDRDHFFMHRYGTDRTQSRSPSDSLHLRLINNANILTMFTSDDGQTWHRYPVGMEVSCYNHNVRGGFLSLRVALYAAGTGEVKFQNFRYHALS